MNSFIDLKYAVRTLLQKPGFALLTVLIMAIGMGLCIYNYSFIYNMSIKDLPFKHSDRLVTINMRIDGSMNNGPVHAPEHFREMKNNSESFEKLGYFRNTTINVSSSSRSLIYSAAEIQEGFFDYTFTQPLMGRVFTESDRFDNAQPVAIISHALWHDFLGGMPNVIGHTMHVSGKSTEIVGVMPAGYAFPMAEDLWIPIQADPFSDSDAQNISVVGLLKKTVSKKAATAELQAVYARLAQSDPDQYQNRQPLVFSFQTSYAGTGAIPLFIAMSFAVIFVLLLASANVANLLYSRAAERAKETAIRVALGAPVKRLIMQMMWESLIICFLGGSLAILLAQIGLEITTGIFETITLGRPPFFWDFSINIHILLTSIGLVVATALITGFFPAWKIISGDFNSILRDGTRGAQSKKTGNLNRALVIFEVSLSCALLTVAAMITMTNYMAKQTDYGFEHDNMLTAGITLPKQTYPEAESQSLFFEQLLDETRRQPGVEAAFLANPLPGLNAYFRPMETQEFEKTDSNNYPHANSAEMSDGAMEALNIQLREGRYFTRNDNANSDYVAIVTQSFVDRFWPKEDDILGKKVRFHANDNEEEFHWMTVVGVVNHVIQGRPYEPQKSNPTVYTPLSQNQWGSATLVVKSGLKGRPTTELTPQINAAIASIDRTIPAFSHLEYKTILSSNTSGATFIGQLFNLFAIAALLLAATGIYGVVANSVQRRTQELGIRRALGASDERIVHMLMRQGWLQFFIGIAIGLPLAYLLGSLILNTMGGISLATYSMLILMPAVIGIVVYFATRIPAKKAVSLEPTIALRYE